MSKIIFTRLLSAKEATLVSVLDFKSKGLSDIEENFTIEEANLQDLEVVIIRLEG